MACCVGDTAGVLPGVASVAGRVAVDNGSVMVMRGSTPKAFDPPLERGGS